MISYISSLSVWKNLLMKPSGSGVFLVERFFIMDLIYLIDKRLYIGSEQPLILFNSYSYIDKSFVPLLDINYLCLILFKRNQELINFYWSF